MMTPMEEEFELDEIKQKLQQTHDFGTDQIALPSNAVQSPALITGGMVLITTTISQQRQFQQ